MTLMKAHTVDRHQTATMLFLRFPLLFVLFVKVNTSEVQEHPSSSLPDQATTRKLHKRVFPSETEYVKEQEQQSGQADLPKQAQAMYSWQNHQNSYENPLQQMPQTYSSQQTTSDVSPSVFRQPVQEDSGIIYELNFDDVPQTKQLSVQELPTNVQQTPLKNRSQMRTPSSVYRNAPVEEKRLPPELPSTDQTQNVQPSTNQGISEQIQQQIQTLLQNLKNIPQTELTQNPSQYTPKKDNYQAYRNPGVENDNHSIRKKIPQHFYQNPFIQRSGQENLARPELNYFQQVATPYGVSSQQTTSDVPPSMFRQPVQDDSGRIYELNFDDVPQTKQHSYQNPFLQRSGQENVARPESNYFLSDGVTNPPTPFIIPRDSETPEDQTQKVTRRIQAGAIRVVKVAPDTA